MVRAGIEARPACLSDLEVRVAETVTVRCLQQLHRAVGLQLIESSIRIHVWHAPFAIWMTGAQVSNALPLPSSPFPEQRRRLADLALALGEETDLWLFDRVGRVCGHAWDQGEEGGGAGRQDGEQCAKRCTVWNRKLRRRRMSPRTRRTKGRYQRGPRCLTNNRCFRNAPARADWVSSLAFKANPSCPQCKGAYAF